MIKATLIINGELKLVLVPDANSNLEKNFLKELKGTTLSVQLFDKPTAILEVPTPDAVVLTVIKETYKQDVPKAVPEVFILLNGAEYITTIAIGPGKYDKVKQAIYAYLNSSPAIIEKDDRYIVHAEEANEITFTLLTEICK